MNYFKKLASLITKKRQIQSDAHKPVTSNPGIDNKISTILPSYNTVIMPLFVSRVSYLSKYVRFIPNRIATRYLNSPASSPPPAEGFEVIWQRAAAMIVALTERQPSKILHVYPCEKFTKYLSEVRYIVCSILLPVYSRIVL